jgi:hypothetical protein
MKSKRKSKPTLPPPVCHLVTAGDIHREIKTLAEDNFTSVKHMTQVLLESAISSFKAGKIKLRA